MQEKKEGFWAFSGVKWGHATMQGVLGVQESNEWVGSWFARLRSQVIGRISLEVAPEQ